MRWFVLFHDARGSDKFDLADPRDDLRFHDEMPPHQSIFHHATPVCETLPGWKSDISGARRWEDLPAEARAYLERVQDEAGCAIVIVSVGPHRDQTIRLL